MKLQFSYLASIFTLATSTTLPEAKNPSPATSRGSSSTVDISNNIIYRFGGETCDSPKGGTTSSSSSATSDKYNPVSGYYDASSHNMPEPLNSHGSAIVDSNLYILGGVNNEGVTQNFIYQYEPTRNAQFSLYPETLNTPSYGISASVSSVNFLDQFQREVTRDGIVFTAVDSNVISAIDVIGKAKPIELLSVEDSILCSTSNLSELNKLYLYSGCQNLYELDTITLELTLVSKIPNTNIREEVTCASTSDGRFYIIGGVTGDGIESHAITYYDKEGESWGELSQFDERLSGFSGAVVVQDNLIIASCGITQVIEMV